MDVANILSQPGREWHARQPASEADIAELTSWSKVQLPAEYLDLLRFGNGGEGPLALPPRYFQLYSVRDCIQLFYSSSSVLEQFENFIFLGSNGGMETIAFDLRTGPPWCIVMIDPVAGPSSAENIAPGMQALIEAIGLEAPNPD